MEMVSNDRAEIDTRAPFKSVKEAVSLFGEKVLAGELYHNNLKQMNQGDNEDHVYPKIGTVKAELEETKQSLQKAKEEGEEMANCLTSLKRELERTKQELRQLKVEREIEKHLIDEPEIEDDLKFVEDTTMFNDHRMINAQTTTSRERSVEFQKKRYVTFANPPSLAQVLIPQGFEILERHPSLKKKKKKPLIPMIGAIFSKKKPSHEMA